MSIENTLLIPIITLIFFFAVVAIVVFSILGPGSPLPVRQALEVVGRIGELVNGIRATFGRSWDFAAQNGFEYGNYSLLQYSVMNAYMERQNNELLQTQLGATELLVEETDTSNFRGTVISIVFLYLLVLISIRNLVVLIIQTCSRRH
jgi:hypothetical protein